MELLCLVIAHVIIRAWEQAHAQAGAEWRRARDEWSAEIGRRMAAGAASGPGESWWWWIAAADRARRSMRGPRAGSQNTALPGSTPWRRLMQAVAAGAAAGRAEGSRRAAERRQSRQDARATRSPRSARPKHHRRPSAGFAGAFAWGFLGGWFAAGWRNWRPTGLRVGVCDNCGSVEPLATLAYQKVDTGARIETWLLCQRCYRPAPAPEPDPLPAVAGAEEYAAVTAGHSSDGPIATSAGDDGDDGDGGDGGDGGDPVTEVTAAASLPLDEPGPVPAVTEDTPYGELAAGDSPPINATEITDGGQQMGTELELAGDRLPAAGDAYSHGAVARAEQSDAELLDQQRLFLAAMLDDLNAVTASRAQVANVTAWADLVAVVAEMFRDVTAEMGRRYGLVIPVIDAVGRDRVAGRMSYYVEV